MQYEKGYIFFSFLKLYSDLFITNSLTLAQGCGIQEKHREFPC